MGLIGFLILLLIFACNGSDVTRPPDINDYDAIYHMVSIDRASEFNIDLLDFSIPDTLASTLTQMQLEHFWFNLTYDSLDLIINLDYPDSRDSLGTLPEADVSEIKLFYGTLEVIGIDTAGGGQLPVRLSTEFVIRGEISAEFKKFGSDYNYRRGWLLTQISDVTYLSGYPQGITQVTINSDSYADHVLSTGLKLLDDVLLFAPGEPVILTVNGSNLNDIFRVRYPQGNGFQTVILEPDSGNNLVLEFQMPEAEQFNHFLVEVIGESSFREDGPFRYESIGVLFEVE